MLCQGIHWKHACESGESVGLEKDKGIISADVITKTPGRATISVEQARTEQCNMARAARGEWGVCCVLFGVSET